MSLRILRNAKDSRAIVKIESFIYYAPRMHDPPYTEGGGGYIIMLVRFFFGEKPREKAERDIFSPSLPTLSLLSFSLFFSRRKARTFFSIVL